jgi:hypothetical protein
MTGWDAAPKMLAALRLVQTVKKCVSLIVEIPVCGLEHKHASIGFGSTRFLAGGAPSGRLRRRHHLGRSGRLAPREHSSRLGPYFFPYPLL